MVLSQIMNRVSKLSSNLHPSTWNIIKDSKIRYSQYPPTYVQPVFKPEEQEALEGTEEQIKLAHSLIRAATGDSTSSEFHDDVLKKFTNHLMKGGNKKQSRGLIEDAFLLVKRHQIKSYHQAAPDQKNQIELNPLKIFHKAIENTKPVLELRSHSRGGITYKIPIPVTDQRSTFLAMKWILQAADDRDKRQVFYPQQLAKELLDAAHNTGRVIRKKVELHKQCEANRAYAHYRWMKKA